MGLPWTHRSTTFWANYVKGEGREAGRLSDLNGIDYCYSHVSSLGFYDVIHSFSYCLDYLRDQVKDVADADWSRNHTWS